MKKYWLASMALVGIVSSQALAADLPPRQAPPPPVKALVAVVPIFTWTGCYIGAQGGYGWGKSTTDAGSALNPIADEPTGDFSSSPKGGIAGGQVGCNYQAGAFVIGIEGEGWWSGMRATTTISTLETSPDGPPTDDHTLKAQNRADGAITGRLGFAADRVLFYGKGGVAFGSFRYTFHDAADAHNFDVSTSRDGWIVGAGIEWAFVNNWIARLEYNYLNFSSHTVNTIIATSLDPFAFSVKETKNIIKAGISYKFGPYY